MDQTNVLDTQYIKYLRRSFSGPRLLTMYQLAEEGFWNIRGADINPDMGGSHFMPNLGTVHGKLEDVVHYAVHLSGFWQEESSGEITKVDVKYINQNTIELEAKLRDRKNELEEELTEINNQLTK